jgi:hypothetical protein
MMSDSTEEKQTITIQLSKELAQLLRFYTEMKGMTVEEFVVALISKTMKQFQTSEKVLKDLADWKFPRLIEVTPLDDFSLKIKFEDGLEGKYDLRLSIQQGGVFSALSNFSFFKQVSIGGNGSYIYWPDEIDIDGRSIYWVVLFDLDWR